MPGSLQGRFTDVTGEQAGRGAAGCSSALSRETGWEMRSSRWAGPSWSSVGSFRRQWFSSPSPALLGLTRGKAPISGSIFCVGISHGGKKNAVSSSLVRTGEKLRFLQETLCLAMNLSVFCYCHCFVLFNCISVCVWVSGWERGHPWRSEDTGFS